MPLLLVDPLKDVSRTNAHALSHAVQFRYLLLFSRSLTSTCLCTLDGIVREGDELFAVSGHRVRGLSIGQLARLVLGILFIV